MSEPFNSSVSPFIIDNSIHSSVSDNETTDKVIDKSILPKSSSLSSRSRPSSPSSVFESSSAVPVKRSSRSSSPSVAPSSPVSFTNDYYDASDDDWSHSEDDDIYFTSSSVTAANASSVPSSSSSPSLFSFLRGNRSTGNNGRRYFFPTEFHTQNNCQRPSTHSSLSKPSSSTVRLRPSARTMLHTNENLNNSSSYTIKESSSLSNSSNGNNSLYSDASSSSTTSINTHLAQKWEAIELTHNERSMDNDTYKIDIPRSRFPFAILWTPIPVLTWIFPFIGHMGICDSRGVAYDFAGPYSIGIDDLAFGLPTRYLVLNPDHIASSRRREYHDKTPTQIWDNAVDIGCEVYSGRMHNLLCDNCHSHVARCLNVMQYNNRTNWNMVTLALLMFIKGKYVTTGRMISMWLPFVIFMVIILSLRYSLFR